MEGEGLWEERGRGADRYSFYMEGFCSDRDRNDKVKIYGVLIP